MTPRLKIFVDGVGSTFRTAERGVLHIEVSATFSSRSEASDKVQGITESLTQKFRAQASKTEDGAVHPLAGITTFTASAMNSSSFIPVDSEGKSLEEKHRRNIASTSFQVVFRDLNLLAKTAAELAAMAYVSVARTEWRLTDATKAVLEHEARVNAIKNAVKIAEDYSTVVGRNVVAVEIRDSPVVFPSASGGRRHYYELPQMQMQTQMPPQRDQGSQAAFVEEGPPSIQPATITATSKISVEFVSSDD